MKIWLSAAAMAAMAACSAPVAQEAGDRPPMPENPPAAGEVTEATAAANRAVAGRLPIGDTGDAEDAARGLIAQIEGEKEGALHRRGCDGDLPQCADPARGEGTRRAEMEPGDRPGARRSWR